MATYLTSHERNTHARVDSGTVFAEMFGGVDSPNLVVVLHVYADESGIHTNGSPAVVVAGLISHKNVWDQAEGLWKAATKRLPDGFHAKDFFHAASCSDYAGWSDADLNNLIDRLCGIMSPVGRKPIHLLGAMVKTGDFHSFNEAERRLLTGAIDFTDDGGSIKFGAPGKPYFLCFEMTIAHADVLTPDTETTAFIFDEQKTYEGYALQAWERIKHYGDGNTKDKLATIAFSSRRHMPMLEAADLAAYLWFQRISEAPMSAMEKGAFERIQEIGAPIEWTKESLVDLMSQSPSILRGAVQARASDGV